MKFIIVLFCIAAMVYGDDKYDSSSDDFDLSQVLENERLLLAYSKCMLDKGPCTPEAKKLKEKLPEALRTNCAKCTDKQKKLGKQVINEVQNKHPQIWTELAAFYDPEGKYKESFAEFLRSP